MAIWSHLATKLMSPERNAYRLVLEPRRSWLAPSLFRLVSLGSPVSLLALDALALDERLDVRALSGFSPLAGLAARAGLTRRAHGAGLADVALQGLAGRTWE